MKRIDPQDLIDLAAEAALRGISLRTDLIYADAEHPLNSTFKEAIYRPGARLFLHRDLAEIVLLAAKTSPYRFVVTDGLRTVEAQRRMAECAIVKTNPHWIGDLISSPGIGGHPRGMAVDIYLETFDGKTLDMGTVLDYFSTNPADNPAARGYKDISQEAHANRAFLEKLMLEAADALNTQLLPLPSEWWDFRLPPDIFNAYAPLNDSDLPPDMRMCS